MRAGREAGPPVRRSRGGPGPARPRCGARTGPGRCPPRPATATRPGACCAGPSPSAGPFCRIRPGRRPAPAPGPGPHPGVPSAAAAAPGPAVTRARAAWWRAGHPAPAPSPAIQPSLTCTLTASSGPSCAAGKTIAARKGYRITTKLPRIGGAAWRRPSSEQPDECRAWGRGRLPGSATGASLPAVTGPGRGCLEDASPARPMRRTCCPLARGCRGTDLDGAG